MQILCLIKQSKKQQNYLMKVSVFTSYDSLAVKKTPKLQKIKRSKALSTFFMKKNPFPKFLLFSRKYIALELACAVKLLSKRA